jgi:hypothetical protein
MESAAAVAQLGALAAAMDRAAQQGSDPLRPTSSDVETGKSNPARITREEGVRRELESYQEAIERHSREQLSSAWAPKTTELLARDVQELQDATGLKANQVDCRSSSCLIHVRFSSYAAARASFATLLHHRYQVNCTRRVALPPPGDPSQPYESVVVLEGCEE